MTGFTFPKEAPPEVVAFFKNKQLKPSFNWSDVWKYEHQVAFTVAKAMQLDILEDIRDGVLKSIREGGTLQQFRKELAPLLQKKGWWGVQEVIDPVTGEKVLAQLGSPRRLRVIYETNLRTARATGQWDRVQRTKKTHPYLLYELGPSREHRKEHTQWQGLLLPADDSFWDTHYPQNGWGCKCRVRQVSRGEYHRIRGKHRLEAPPIQRREWMNQRTGEVLDVPKGIDPGWDYNPGEGRLNHFKQQVQQKERQLKQAIKTPLPEQAVKAPAPFSTVKHVNGEQVNRLLNELGTPQSRTLFNEFLKAHPIQTVLAKATEIGGKKAIQNKALQARIAEHLGVPEAEAFRHYGHLRAVGRINGFTGVNREVVTVKVKANSDLRKAESDTIRQGLKTVYTAAEDNTGAYRTSGGQHRLFSISDAVGQNTPEQLVTTLIHEMGHQVHFWAGAPQSPSKQVLTRYADSNKYEWFAEHFAAWYLDPKALRKWDAKTADHIEATLKIATENRSPLRKGR